MLDGQGRAAREFDPGADVVGGDCGGLEEVTALATIRVADRCDVGIEVDDRPPRRRTSKLLAEALLGVAEVVADPPDLVKLSEMVVDDDRQVLDRIDGVVVELAVVGGQDRAAVAQDIVVLLDGQNRGLDLAGAEAVLERLVQALELGREIGSPRQAAKHALDGAQPGDQRPQEGEHRVGDRLILAGHRLDPKEILEEAAEARSVATGDRPGTSGDDRRLSQ